MDPTDTLATLGSIFLVICIIVIVLAAVGAALMWPIVKRDRDEHRARMDAMRSETRARMAEADRQLDAGVRPLKRRS